MNNPFSKLLGSYSAKARSKDDLAKKLAKIDEITQSQKRHTKRVGALLDALDYERELISSIMNTVPDWAWCKDNDGYYVKVNEAIVSELFCGLPLEHVLNHNDVEIATRLKEIHGAENHTFGQLCANSDDIVLHSGISYKFYEVGLVKGKMLRVIVFKAVLRNSEGDIIGTVGTGRNITEDYNELLSIAGNADDVTEKKILDYLEKYRFDDDSVMKCRRKDDLPECMYFPRCGKEERCNLEKLKN